MTEFHSRFEQAFATLPLVAILRGIGPGEAAGAAYALVQAGFTLVEVPLNSPQPFDSVARMVEAVGTKAMIGVGTVYRPVDVDAAANAGATLVVSPNTDPAVIARTKERGLVSLPGVFTPTEAALALASGADALKIFPAELASPASVKAMRAVLPAETRILMVGGISPDNMHPWRAAGANGFGIGSSLYVPGRPVLEIGIRARAFVGAWQAA